MMTKNVSENPCLGGQVCGVGEKTEKVGEGIFRPLERICFLDESKPQQAVKNANLETFILTIV
jgi:hypothetical protein